MLYLHFDFFLLSSFPSILTFTSFLINFVIFPLLYLFYHLTSIACIKCLPIVLILCLIYLSSFFLCSARRRYVTLSLHIFLLSLLSESTDKHDQIKCMFQYGALSIIHYPRFIVHIRNGVCSVESSM